MPEATDDDGSCIMPPEGYCDCDGNVFDECGDCNGDGPTPGYDCDDNCISQEILFQVDMWGAVTPLSGRYTTLMVMWYCLATILTTTTATACIVVI